MKQIFPKEIIDNTLEVYLFKNKVKSQIIYTVLLLFIIGVFASLPFINIEVYTTSQGFIKSKNERVKIVSLYAGKIIKNNIKENQQVKKTDTLLIIDNAITQEKIKLIKSKINETQNYIWDLELLTKMPENEIDSLTTLKYQKIFNLYIQKKRELKTKFNKSKRDYYRQLKLYRKKIIAKVEFLNTKYNYDLIKDEVAYFTQQQKSTWQTELSQLQTQIDELKNSLVQQEQENKNYFITAPISGSIQNLIGLDSGSLVNIGTPICEISPESNLIAECYVSPVDIGLINKNNTVKFQIDAYDYNQWGMLSGKIFDIGKDISMINNTPVYKVRCSFDTTELHLKSGAVGKIKKGMTLRARFFIANRSLFDLLYDKVDDWFNPSKNK